MNEIHITSPVNTLGYGVAGANIILALDKLGVKVNWWPLGNPEWPNEQETQILQKCVQNRQTYNESSPSLRIWHQHDLAQHIGKGEHIGFPIFELDNFKPLEIEEMKKMDRLFVCSKWAKDVIQKLLKTKTPASSPQENMGIDYITTTPRVNVVPLGVNTQIFNGQYSTHKQKDVTRFINIGKWEVRKGHDILIEVFNSLYDKYGDKVELWMLCNNPFLTPEQTAEWDNLYKANPQVRILERQATQADVARIISQCDVGVFPSRAEGWNLELLECMAHGLQVITTDYSAHTEFCTSENASLIEIENLEDAYDGIWFMGNHGKWAEIGTKQEDQLFEYMVKLHEDHLRDPVKFYNHAGLETATKFSWENTAKSILNAF